MRKLTALLVIAAGAALLLRAEAPDPLAAEIQKWRTFLSSGNAKGDTWEQIKSGAEPVLTRANDALQDGRRLLAFQRLAAVWPNLIAAEWATPRSVKDGKEDARLESEWKRVGVALRDDLRAKSVDLSDIQPAAMRGYAEAAVPQVRAYYDASLEYGRSTMADSGFFYLGAAQAERKFIDLARSMSQKTTKRPPAVRAIDAELEAVEHDLLDIYRPPMSIDRHPEFIGAGAALKEARELNAAGLRYGAMVRYMEALRRTGQLRGKALNRGDAVTQLRQWQARVADRNVDHSIAQVYIESAQSDLAAPNSDVVVASSIVSYVLPHYFASLGPAPQQKPKPAPNVTVTLVRWPYT